MKFFDENFIFIAVFVIIVSIILTAFLVSNKDGVRHTSYYYPDKCCCGLVSCEALSAANLMATAKAIDESMTVTYALTISGPCN